MIPQGSFYRGQSKGVCEGGGGDMSPPVPGYYLQKPTLLCSLPYSLEAKHHGHSKYTTPSSLLCSGAVGGVLKMHLNFLFLPPMNASVSLTQVCVSVSYMCAHRGLYASLPSCVGMHGYYASVTCVHAGDSVHR